MSKGRSRGAKPLFFNSPSQTKNKTGIKVYLFERGIQGVSIKEKLLKINIKKEILVLMLLS
jgi:hypothetical protein